MAELSIDMIESSKNRVSHFDQENSDWVKRLNLYLISVQREIQGHTLAKPKPPP